MSMLRKLSPVYYCIKTNVSRIVNPLAKFTRDEVIRNVEGFVEEKGMADIAHLLRKGALVARDPTAFDSIEDLDDEERAALQNEVSHKWHQPRALYLTVVLCSVAAAVQ
jgi:hypothetical protein